MFHKLKKSWLVLALLAWGTQSVLGFSLMGPAKTNPAQDLGQEAWEDQTLGLSLPGDVGAPKNFTEGYRWNHPDIYYAFDDTFVNYFGEDGAAEVDKAIAIFNSLTNLSAYSFQMDDLPRSTARINYRARNLQLVDIKSMVLAYVIEELGLEEPTRFIWNIHDRDITSGQCPNYLYLVVMRNYNPSSPNVYSPYVNDVLFSYWLDEYCGLNPNPFTPILAEALEYVVDANSPLEYAPVADRREDRGLFYTGLTRDDMAGLKFLLATNSANAWHWENPGTNSLLADTNFALNLLWTSNYANIFRDAFTNDRPTLQALYPNLLILDSRLAGFTNLIATNIYAYFTNYPFSPAGTPASLVLATNFTTNPVPYYSYVFGNVVTNSIFTNQAFTLLTVSNRIPVGSPAGTPAQPYTNYSTIRISNSVYGEYFVLPTNANCGFSIVGTQLTTIVTTTNAYVTTTNIPGVTNVPDQNFGQYIVTYFTNHVLLVSVPTCVTNGGGPGLYQGVDRIRFHRHDYDSYLSHIYTPVTNAYTLTMMSSTNTLTVRNFTRVVRQPDILFRADDLASGPNAPLVAGIIARSTPVFDNANSPAPGPGTLQPSVQITFNNVGPHYAIQGPFFVDGTGAHNPASIGEFDFNWASYDGSTNAPVVYPNWISLNNLEGQLYLQITVSGPLANAREGVPYSAALQLTGNSPPFTWSMAPDSPALPPGLALTTGTDTMQATISGTPTTGSAGVYDFQLQVQDAAGRTTQRHFTIEIDP